MTVVGKLKGPDNSSERAGDASYEASGYGNAEVMELHHFMDASLSGYSCCSD